MKHFSFLIALFLPLSQCATEISLQEAFCSKKVFDRERDNCHANIYYRKGFAGYDYQCYKDICLFECSLGANRTCFSTVLNAEDCTKADYRLAFCRFVSRNDPTTYPYCMENEIDLHDFFFTPAVCMNGNCIPAEMLCNRNEILWPHPTTSTSTTTSSTSTTPATTSTTSCTTSATTSSTTTSTPRLVAEESFSFNYINKSYSFNYINATNSTFSRKRKCTSSDYSELSGVVS